MRISDWSSDVCSSDLASSVPTSVSPSQGKAISVRILRSNLRYPLQVFAQKHDHCRARCASRAVHPRPYGRPRRDRRSEEHTSELQSLMRISYAVFCLKKKTTHTNRTNLTVQTHT